MKVLLTGASGFIGKHLVKKLEHDGIDYIAIGRNLPNNKKNIRSDLISSEDPISTLKKIKPTHLIHLAWYAEHGKYWESPLNVYWLMASTRLIEAFCQSGGKHVVVAGTCAEYDWRYGFCVEDLTPLNPGSLYGIAKKTTYSLSNYICSKYGVGLSWARIFFPYGPGEASQRLIPSLINVFKGKGLPFGVNSDSYRDLLHVEDVARAFLVCAHSKYDGAINVCSGKPLQISNLVSAVARIYNCETETILKLAPKNPDATRFLVGENKKLQSLGWTQEIMLEQGLLKYKAENIRSSLPEGF